MQNINLITQFLRHCILVILSTLVVPSNTHQKWQYQFTENCDAQLHKKSPSSLNSFLRYSKDFANLLFWVIWAGLAMPTKINSIKL